ncbi:hypothetical protein J1G43_13060 [Cellulomonas sp. zg-ZUI22]|uniref:hypothetical protein n=1 Tax=Cellulomonas sp. zg-ZUI22 TaxID=2816955 RepID=UPI001A940665|nr:hypothetical protein [Cellulomonas sp. zg-ZUI22]MBO0900891.1 hypothetical protein [Cellulomonas sp. zg-ZUI22]
MNLPVLLLSLAVAALVACLVAVVAARAATSAVGEVVVTPAAYDRARRHAATVALVAWAVLSAVAVLLPGAVPDGPGAGVALGCVPAVAGLAFLLVAAVGERTWPAPRGTVRGAALTRRTARDVAPRWTVVALLTWTALLLGTLLATGVTAGPDGRTVVLQPDALVSTAAGPYPGAPYAVPLAAATVLLAVATWGVLHLVAARPAVAGVSTDDDALLRRVSGARVVAGVQLVVGGTLAAVLLATGKAVRSAAHATYAVDGVSIEVVQPVAAALGTAAIAAAPVVGLTTLLLAATALLRSSRAAQPRVAVRLDARVTG